MTTPLTSTVGASAAATALAWDTDPSKTLRDVQLELTGRIDDIEAEYVRLDVAADMSRYPIMVALIQLGSSLRRAAQAVAARTPRIFQVTVDAPAPLYVIAAQIYGASEAVARADQMREINDIRNPARVEKGTVLKAQSPLAPRAMWRSPS